MAQRNTKFHLHQHPATRQAYPILNIVWRIVIPENHYPAFLLNLATGLSIRSQKVQSQQKVLAAAGLFGSYSNGPHLLIENPSEASSYTRVIPTHTSAGDLLLGVLVLVFSSQPRTLPCANLRWTGVLSQGERAQGNHRPQRFWSHQLYHTPRHWPNL